MMELNDAYLRDADEFMADLPDDSVDLVLTDPPYGILPLDWDSEYKLLNWSEVRRILKPTGVVLVFGNQPYSSLVIGSNPKWFRYEIIWAKSQGTDYLNSKRKPLKAHENILVFFENTKSTYNVVKNPGKSYQKASSSRVGRHIKDKKVGGYFIKNQGRFPLTVMNYHLSNTERGLHPTQKPLALIKRLVQMYSNSDDLVIDPFMGSGTTLVAARELGRRYAGCDIEKEYFQIAQDRLSKPFNLPLFSDDDDEEDSLGVDDMMMDIES